MAVEDGPVEVRVSNRILYVGSTAYPLQHVTSVEPVVLTPRRGEFVRRFFRRVGFSILAAVVALIVIACASGEPSGGAYVAIGLALVGLLILHLFRLVRDLALPNLYVLAVENAAARQAAVATENRLVIEELVEKVIAAIDNPAVLFTATVNNHVGDVVKGDKYQGDKVAGHKLVG
jgi:hypothetical protein